MSLEIPDDLVLDRDREVLVYRVAREALVNATKHSLAQAVSIRIRQSGGCTEIMVVDDGVGFDPQGSRPEGHFGLRILGDTFAKRMALLTSVPHLEPERRLLPRLESAHPQPAGIADNLPRSPVKALPYQVPRSAALV